MISLFLTLAMAQELPKLPNELHALNTCRVIYQWHEAKYEKEIEKARVNELECHKTRAKLPKNQQQFVVCYTTRYYGAPTMIDQVFMQQCREVLNKMNVNKSLYGPWNVEDFK